MEKKEWKKDFKPRSPEANMDKQIKQAFKESPVTVPPVTKENTRDTFKPKPNNDNQNNERKP